jgi:L-alanine-DL-glutamate epimerase-like enolase superfamily enzyme
VDRLSPALPPGEDDGWRARRAGSMSMTDPVTGVSVGEVTLKLPQELELGHMRVTERHYTVVKVRCASGIVGQAFAQTRGAPVGAIVDGPLADTVIGGDAADIDVRWQDMFRATIAVGRTGLVMRAISLLDLALWDGHGRRCGVPVSRLLSRHGVRRRIPVIYVAGYPLHTTDLDEVAAAALEATRRGHSMIKLARTPSQPRVTRQMLDQMDGILPSGVRVIVDANWGWADVDEAVHEIRTWPADRVAWAEDPFPPEEVRMIRELRRKSPVQIGAGDDLTDRVHAGRLLDEEAVDVLRVDIAAIGGITGARRVIRQAEAAHVPVSFHISPESSIHLALAYECCESVETFDRSGNRLDPSHELVSGGPVFSDGYAELADEPGLGFAILRPDQL